MASFEKMIVGMCGVVTSEQLHDMLFRVHTGPNTSEWVSWNGTDFMNSKGVVSVGPEMIFEVRWITPDESKTDESKTDESKTDESKTDESKTQKEKL